MIGRFDDKTQGDLDAAKAGVHAPKGTEEPGVQESELVKKSPTISKDIDISGSRR
jgi:hypothetical protein